MRLCGSSLNKLIVRDSDETKRGAKLNTTHGTWDLCLMAHSNTGNPSLPWKARRSDRMKEGLEGTRHGLVGLAIQLDSYRTLLLAFSFLQGAWITMSCMGEASFVGAVAVPDVDRAELDHVFQLCRSDKWREVLTIVEEKPSIALSPLIMDNHISTTILHQAITSKGPTAIRARVVSTVLTKTPKAAELKNGYGSLPLHVIAQRNTKIDSQTKEKLILALIKAFKGALTEQGGVGKRTPLHIIFTDYISPGLTRVLIENGKEACFMKDRKGYLPAHVACSRHCSPEKLRMLLAVNPGSLYEKTINGETLLSLANTSATKSHPNYALIDELNRQLKSSSNVQGVATPPAAHVNYWSSTHMISSEESDSSRGRLDSNDSDKSLVPRRQFGNVSIGGPVALSTPVNGDQYLYRQVPTTTSRKRCYPSSSEHFSSHPRERATQAAPMDPVDLLLHFSRNGSRVPEERPASPFPHDQYAEV